MECPALVVVLLVQLVRLWYMDAEVGACVAPSHLVQLVRLSVHGC